MKGQIIAMGGGGFSMEQTPALDRYILAQANKPRPSVCFLGQASGDAESYVLKFYRAFTLLDARPTALSLFQPHTADIEGFLMSQDIIYVGGGNTRSLVALWQEWELDRILLNACANGTVLAGISAGAICWFEQGLSDSVPGGYRVFPFLGYLSGSCSPHYDGEVERRPTYQRLIGTGDILPGYAFDDSAAGHFVDGTLTKVVASRPMAHGYRLERDGERAVETPLQTQYLD